MVRCISPSCFSVCDIEKLGVVWGRGYIYKQIIMYYVFTRTGELATIIQDFGGRVEELRLQSKSQGKLRDVLLTHKNNATAINENEYWKGMLLIPWANRIAYVSE